MASVFWQQAKTFTLAPAGTGVFALNPRSPLERLTIWAVSGSRVVSFTLQPRVNAQAQGAATVIAAAVAHDVVYRSGGASAEDDILPFVSPTDLAPGATGAAPKLLDSFTFDILITNNGGTAASITLLAVACEHVGV